MADLTTLQLLSSTEDADNQHAAMQRDSFALSSRHVPLRRPCLHCTSSPAWTQCSQEPKHCIVNPSHPPPTYPSSPAPQGSVVVGNAGADAQEGLAAQESGEEGSTEEQDGRRCNLCCPRTLLGQSLCPTRRNLMLDSYSELPSSVHFLPADPGPSARLAAFQKQSRAAPVVHPSRRTGPRRVPLPLGAESTKSTPSPDPEEQTNKQDYMRDKVLLGATRSIACGAPSPLLSSSPEWNLTCWRDTCRARVYIVTAGVQNEVVEGGRAVRRSQVFKPTKQGNVGPGAWGGDGATSTSHSSLTDCRPLLCRTSTYSKSSPTIPH